MKSFTTSELRQNAAEVLDEASREVVLITHHNKPRAAVMSWEAYEGLVDAFDALLDPRIEERVRTGLQEFYDGKVLDWETTQAKLCLPDSLSRSVARLKFESVSRKPGKMVAAYLLKITLQGEEDLGQMASETVRIEVGRAINGLSRGPEIGKRTRYLAGLYMLRAGRAHYLIVYKIVEATRTVTVLAVIPESQGPARFMKPYTEPKGRKPRSKAAARREEWKAAEEWDDYKEKKKEEKKQLGKLDEEEEKGL